MPQSRPRTPESLHTRLRRIRLDLGLTQHDFGVSILGKDRNSAQQSVASAEKHQRVSAKNEQAIRKNVPKLHLDRWERVQAVLEGADLLSNAFSLEAQSEREVEIPEGDSWCFALQFRNAIMLDRIACHARQAGLEPLRVADGLVLTGPTRTQQRPSLTELLYPSPQKLGLKPGMAILLGDPQNHRAANEILNRFLASPVSKGCNIRISVFHEKPAYIGYPTCLKVLSVKKKTYEPRRWADPTGPAVCYEDFGVIYSALIGPLLHGAAPFPGNPSHLILISGLHRLATGVGVALLEDLDLRQRLLKGYPVFSGDGFRALAYRVVVRADNRLWSQRPAFRWCHSEVRRFEVVGTWREPGA